VADVFETNVFAADVFEADVFAADVFAAGAVVILRRPRGDDATERPCGPPILSRTRLTTAIARSRSLRVHSYMPMETSSYLTLVALGSAVEALGWSTREWPIDEPIRLAQLISRLEDECARLAQAHGRIRFAVNQAYADPDTLLQPGDEVAIIPPVSGGCGPEYLTAYLIREPIDVAELLSAVEHESIGAIATFVGVVRAETRADQRPLEALEYTAHERMAQAQMSSLAEAIAQAHGVSAYRLVHRLGTLCIGEASVAAIVSSPHRDAAFTACREMIERLKLHVPIFKREIWADGETTWVDGI